MAKEMPRYLRFMRHQNVRTLCSKPCTAEAENAILNSTTLTFAERRIHWRVLSSLKPPRTKINAKPSRERPVVNWTMRQCQRPLEEFGWSSAISSQFIFTQNQ